MDACIVRELCTIASEEARIARSSGAGSSSDVFTPKKRKHAKITEAPGGSARPRAARRATLWCATVSGVWDCGQA